MRGRCLDAGIGGAGFPDHHRLAHLQRLAPNIQQAPRVGRTFHVGEHNRRAGIVQKRRQQLRHVDVGLVARRHADAEADALRLGEVHDRIAEPARLERARHRARTEFRLVRHAAERRPHARLDRQHALAVGADDAHAAFLDRAHQLVLELAPFGAGLTEAGGEHHRERNAGLAAIAHRLRHAGRRHGDDGQVARLADRHGVRIALEPVHLGILRIDEIQAALVARVLERLDRMPADARQVRRCPDDGNRFGVKQALEAHEDPPVG